MFDANIIVVLASLIAVLAESIIADLRRVARARAVATFTTDGKEEIEEVARADEVKVAIFAILLTEVLAFAIRLSLAG